MTTPRSGAVELPDGRRLVFCEWGDAGGPPVVLLHGAPGSRLFHPDAATTTASGVRLVTFDRPGYGGSHRNEGRTLLDTAFDVVALADHLGLERFSVVGVSAGGAHALACAHAARDRLAHVAVASTPGPLDEVPGAWAALPQHVRPAAERARHDPQGAARGVLRYMRPFVEDPGTFLGGGTRPDRAVLSEPAVAGMLGADVTEAFRPGADGFADDMLALWRPWGFRIAALPPGVRIWHGAHDTRAEPDFRHLAATLPGARPTIWPGEGHYGALRHWREILETCL
ncbi:MAG TPA: alpha/beta hydrolase [Acidimicrobiia bacterium]